MVSTELHGGDELISAYHSQITSQSLPLCTADRLKEVNKLLAVIENWKDILKKEFFAS